MKILYQLFNIAYKLTALESSFSPTHPNTFRSPCMHSAVLPLCCRGGDPTSTSTVSASFCWVSVCSKYCGLLDTVTCRETSSAPTFPRLAVSRAFLKLPMRVSLILKERDECCSSGFTSPNEWFIDLCWKQSALLTTGSRVQMGAVFPFLCKPNGIDCLRTNTFSFGSFYFSDFCHSQCL